MSTFKTSTPALLILPPARRFDAYSTFASSPVHELTGIVQQRRFIRNKLKNNKHGGKVWQPDEIDGVYVTAGNNPAN